MVVVLATHLAEIHSAVFSADVLFALVVGRLGLRRDRLAFQRAGKQYQFSQELFSQMETMLSCEQPQATVTTSGKSGSFFWC